uniref:Pre-mRNA cleavage complex 2 protein Pcf11 n=1 Tax=Latimeria chalumnae TaxID=7897 RepID=H3AK79_LATCH
MSEDAAKEDACGEYQSSLEDLTFNSKPHINMLTILAEENLQFAKDIVTLIEAQIAKAPASEKLPVMYLMDSIVKNVGREYLAAFTKNLVSTFVCVFEKVDENTRKSLFKLRSTWDEIFPVKKLYALDVRVNTVDPAWPIKPLPPNVNTSSIHVNPKFLSKSPEDPTPPSPVVNAPVIPAPTNVPDLQKNLTQEQVIRQQLLAKQKQLLELQQKKIELELEQTKAQLAVSLAAQQGSGTNLATPPIPPKLPVSSANPPVGANKSSHQVFVPQEKNRPLQLQSSRDPRLNRLGQQASHGKDQGQKKSPQISASHQIDSKPNKNPHTEKPTSKHEKKPDKLFKKEPEVTEEKNKSKLPSPLKNKSTHLKDVKSPDVESTRAPEINKRDPRLRKHLQDKTDDKDDETKEKRKCSDKRERDHKQPSEHRPVGNRNKFINGNYQKQEKDAEALERQSSKQGRSSGRKRSRSQSRSPVAHSPKRRERRSPKRRQKSISPPLSSKLGKMRQTGPKQSHSDGFVQCAITREERNPLKKGNKPDPRDPRRLKRIPEERFPESVDSHSAKLLSEPKENIENWQGSKPPKRWKSGWEENKSSQQSKDHQGSGKPAHQRHRDSWSSNKGIMSPRVLKHHRLSVDDNLQIPKELTSASKRDLLKKANERLASGEITQDDFLVVAHQINQLFQYQEVGGKEDQRPHYNERFTQDRSQFEESNDPSYKEGSGPRFEGPKGNQRFGGTAEEMRPRFEGPPDHSGRGDGLHSRLEGPSGPRFDGPPNHPDTRIDGPQGQQAPQRFDGPPRFEEPQGQQGPPRFEGPLRFEGPQGPQGPPRLEGPQGPPRLEGPQGPPRLEGPQGPPRLEGPPGLPRLEGPQGQQGPLRFEGPQGQQTLQRFEGLQVQQVPPRFEGLQVLQGLSRFEGPPGQQAPPRFEGPSNLQGLSRFEGPPGQQAPPRFEGPPSQQAPLRFEGIPGQQTPPRFEGPPGPLGPRFERQQAFSGPSLQGLPRFDGGLIQSGSRFEGPHVLRFDGPPSQAHIMSRFDGVHGQRFDRPPGQQTPPRFEGPLSQQPQLPPNFDATPNHSVPRLDVQGQPGLVFDNVPNQSGPRLESTHFRNFNLPCGQGGPIFNESLNHTFNGPPQGMSFQRPSESRFDVSQVHSFNAPPVTGGPNLANPLNPGPYQNLQGASLGNFSSIPASAPVGNIPPPQSASVMSGLNQTVSFSQGQQFITPQSQSSVTFMQNQPGPSFVHPENHLGQLDVNELFAKLLSTGILQVTQADSASTQSNEATAQPQPAVEEEEEDDQSEDQDIPDLTSFTIEDMKQRYDSVINRLYTGIQCYSCGMRFTTSQTDVYADHLDWHFRQNRTEKDVSKKVTHRRWYYSLTDWIEFEEIADLEERAKSQFFEKVHEEVILKTQEAAKEKEFPSVPAGPAGVDECCEICEEQFEQYWDEEEEEWHLKNAMRVDEKIYHPTCYEDYKKTSSFLDSTPSPSKAPVENPLNAMLDTVKQEPTETFSTCQIKQEVTDPFSGCSEENKCSSKDIKTEPDEKEPV